MGLFPEQGQIVEKEWLEISQKFQILRSHFLHVCVFALIFEILYLWGYFASARLNLVSFLSAYDIGLYYIYFLFLTTLVAILGHVFGPALFKNPPHEGTRKRKASAYPYIYAFLILMLAAGGVALEWLAVRQGVSIDRVTADLLSQYVMRLEAPIIMAVLFSLAFILLLIWLIESRKIFNGTYRHVLSGFIAFLLILTPLAGAGYGFSKRVWWLIAADRSAAMPYWDGSTHVVLYRNGRLTLLSKGE